MNEFPEGFGADMMMGLETLHKHHMTQLSLAMKRVEDANKEVERWRRLEEASGCLDLVMKANRWAKEGKGDQP